MNFSEDDIRIIHVHKKHKCTLCDFRTHKKYNLNVHLRGIHGIPYIKEQSTQIQSGFGSVVTSFVTCMSILTVCQNSENSIFPSAKTHTALYCKLV